TETSDELRIGVTMSLDWFGRKTSVYGPSHSSGVLSLYRAENLLVSFMTPGPTEPTGAQLQNYLKLIVDDLLKLYDEGVIYHTQGHPEGRRVRVVLLGVICDHPAMCKMCGFADHGHKNAPCPKCKVSKEKLFSDESLSNKFEPRSSEEHRRQCFEDKVLPTQEDHEEFFEEHGVRWTELARLPYFDLVRQCVIDPMHNLLLGIVKTQWYSQWILTPALRASTQARARELEMIHAFLHTVGPQVFCLQFEAPLWAGKLPLRVGEPAGGSLTADEYKFAATTAWPVIIPVVWDSFIEEAEKDYSTASKTFAKRQDQFLADYKAWKDRQDSPQGTTSTQKGKTKKGKTRANDDQEPKPPNPPKVRMQHDEPVNFLRLSSALKIFCGSSIKLDTLSRAKSLLEEYLLEFKRLYGPEAMKPNFHWAVHLSEQILDYGPVYNFWAFLSERLNKVLKSSNSNNWTGGQIEISMMREFARGAQIDALARGALMVTADNSVTKTLLERLIGDQNEASGTIQDAATEIRFDDLNSYLRIQPGPSMLAPQRVSDQLRVALYMHYNSMRPHSVHYALESTPRPGSTQLNDFGLYYQYALLDGRRITPLSRTNRESAGSSIVKGMIEDKTYYGEVINIFSHRQLGVTDGMQLLAEMRWMIELPLSPVENDPWSDL
ncbi:hypothetical protein HYDPIDRAFT_171515, partial [Hydnomerulius pinastri MD-312]